MKKLIVGLSFLSLSLVASAAPVAASSFKIKIKRVAVSTSGDCSNPVIVYDSGKSLEELSYVDLASNPDLFSEASVANGTYNCVIWEVSDKVKFTPAADDGSSCVAASGELTRDICGLGTEHPVNGVNAAILNPNKLIDSSSNTACSIVNDDVKPLYFSTWSTATTGNGVQTGVPPTQQNDSTKGLKLAAPLVVSGATQGILEFDTTGAITTWDSDYDPLTAAVCSPEWISFSLQ